MTGHSHGAVSLGRFLSDLHNTNRGSKHPVKTFRENIFKSPLCCHHAFQWVSSSSKIIRSGNTNKRSYLTAIKKKTNCEAHQFKKTTKTILKQSFHSHGKENTGMCLESHFRISAYTRGEMRGTLHSRASGFFVFCFFPALNSSTLFQGSFARGQLLNIKPLPLLYGHLF